MSLRDKVAQLIIMPIYGEPANTRSTEFRKYQHFIRDLHVGGVIVTGHSLNGGVRNAEPYAMAALINRLQKMARTPLFVTADFERGASMRVNSTTAWPYSMAFAAAKDLTAVSQEGADTARDARAMGVNWLFAPVADVNNNPDNPIINIRSYGENPAEVSSFVQAYIAGAHSDRENPLLVTAKHFPGHGDTATDSHLGLAEVTGDHARLDAVELPPFRRAIEAGVDAVMVAHVTIPALDAKPNQVATTSSTIVTGLLQEEMGFKGIVVTDALDMAGLTRLYANDIGRAAVETFKAGNDVLIIPADLDASYRSLLQAVQSGEISRLRLDHSVRKVLELKASLGLNKARLADPGKLPSLIAKPENLATGQRIADEAITLVRDNNKVIPLKETANPLGSPGTSPGTRGATLPYQSLTEVHNRLVLVILADDLRTDPGRMLERQTLARVPDARVIYVDARSAAGLRPAVVEAVEAAEHVIAAVDVVPTAGKAVRAPGGGLTNTVAIDGVTGSILTTILDHAAERTVVLAIGNPYVVQDFPAIQNYLCAFSNATVSETAAVKAIFGEIAIRGHLPVTIPGIASRGEGLERAALPIPAAPPSSGGSSHVQP